MISTCIILALAVQSAVAGSHESCSGGCTCEPTSGATKMTCSTSLFSSFTIFEQQLPQNIVELYLSNQPFSHLHIQPSNVHKFSAIKTLSIKYSEVSSISDSFISSLPRLQYFTLTHSPLKIVPPDLFPFNSFLESLTLENCYLNEIHENAFMSLRYLDRLNLNSNFLVDLPEKLFRNLIRLKHLSLSYNEIRVLPSAIFEGLSKLERLEIKNNELKIIDSTLFRPLTNLLELHIPHNKIETLEKDAFKSQTQLLDICIDNNKISKWDSQVFSPLKKLTFMKALKNEFDSWPIVSELPDLEQLYINDNAIVDIPTTPEYIPKLRILHIGGNLFEYLYKGTFNSVPLEEINIGWCNYLKGIEKNLFPDVVAPFCLYINENPRLCMTHDHLMSLEELTGDPIPLEVKTTDTCPPIPPRGMPAPTDRPVQTNNSFSLIAIIAIVVAAVLLIFLIMLIVCCIRMKRKSKMKNTENRLDRNRGNVGNKREDYYSQQRYDYPDMVGGYQGLHMAPSASRPLPVPPQQADIRLPEVYQNSQSQATNNSMYIH